MRIQINYIQNLTITGTFSFTGFRLAVDADGNPVLDTNGDQIIEDEDITLLESQEQKIENQSL